MTTSTTATIRSTTPHSRIAKVREPDAIEKQESGYVFCFHSDKSAWTLTFTSTAVAYLESFNGRLALPTEEAELAVLRDLRRFGLLELGSHGDIVEPVCLSEFGQQTKRALAQLADAPPGAYLSLM